MTRAKMTLAEREALEELEHNCDLIGTRPLPCEIEWALAGVATRSSEYLRCRDGRMGA